MLVLPSNVVCGLCSELCKRAVKVPCCDGVACRACAVKAVTLNHQCWNEKCAKSLSGSDIINNDSLRVEIEAMSDGTILNCGLCKEMCKRGAKIDCCGARACRACAIKEITKSRLCWSCSKPGRSSENLVNDDLLRSAVEHFKIHKIILPEHRIGLSMKAKTQEVFIGQSESTRYNVKSTLIFFSKVKEKLDSKIKPSTAPTKQIPLLLSKPEIMQNRQLKVTISNSGKQFEEPKCEVDEEQLRTLFVGSLNEKVDEEILYELFQNAGPLENVKIPKDRETKKQKHFGFVKFQHEESVKFAYDLLNNVQLFGQRLRLQNKETGLGMRTGFQNHSRSNTMPNLHFSNRERRDGKRGQDREDSWGAGRKDDMMRNGSREFHGMMR